MSPSTITLWDGRLDLDGLLPDTLRASLDDTEKQRGLRAITPRDGRRFTVTRGALRSILAFQLAASPRSLRLGTSADGKPFLVDHPELHFNLSHAGDRFLVAVSRDGPVGVDLEPVPDERTLSGTRRRVLSAPESALFDALAGGERREWFARLWTRKEAYIKGDGRGLRLDLTLIDVMTRAPEVLLRKSAADDRAASAEWAARSVPAYAGYAAAVAAEGDAWEVERIHWPGPIPLAG